MLGRNISHYEVLEELGAGGMGVVFKARDTQLERTVVLKSLPAKDSADEKLRRRFLHEARAASSLNHPNIITVHGVVRQDGVDFMVLEYIEGRSLADLLRQGGLPTARALKLAIEIARALGAAHAAGIVHRDVKPGNVMVTDTGRVKVLDFGLAKRQTPGEKPLTEPGMLLGTAPYMSPEQALGREVDARSDVFAFGTMLYEILSGNQPFARKSLGSVLEAVVNEEPPRLEQARPHLPAALSAIVQRAMAKVPDERFQSMEDLAEALEAIAAGSPDAPTLATLAVGESAGSSRAVRRRARWLGRRPAAIWLLVGTLVVIAAAGGIWRMASDRSSAAATIRSLVLSGRVEDPQGNPIHEAKVTVMGRRGVVAWSRPDGRFTVSPRVDGHQEAIRFYVSHDAYVNTEAARQLSELDPVDELDPFVLEPERPAGDDG